MNNIELSAQELKEISLRGLTEFSKVCNENGYTFWLAYGSLIGAVRHKGFIPWDDDIDLWMPRKDYESFLNKYQNILIADEWEIFSHKNKKGYYFPWIKLCSNKTILTPSRFNSGLLYGSSIDIFPLDNMNSGNIDCAYNELKKINSEYKKEIKKLRPYTGGLKGVNTIWKKLGKKVYFNSFKLIYGDPAKIIDKYENIKLLNDNSNDHIFIATSPCASYPWVWEAEDFSRTVILDFENLCMPAPASYDSVLRRVYGNYLEIPPKDKQVSDHSYKVFRI